MISVDMVGSTRILQEIGQEKAFGLIQRILTIAKKAVADHGGTVIDTAGDGVLAAFGAPQALENAPLQACWAAVRFQDQIRERLPKLETDFGVSPQFRIGIAGGDVLVVALQDGQIKTVGDSVNLAARLQSIAAPDEILLSDDILREVDGFVRTTDLGAADMKGFAESKAYHRLDGIAAVRSRFEGLQKRGLAKLVSRTAELDQIIAQLDPVTGPNIVGVLGPAGIGKSRLIHEVMTKLPPDRPIYIGQCAPTGQTAFGPLHSIVRQTSSASSDAPFQTVLAQLVKDHPGLCDPDLIENLTAPTPVISDPLNRVLQERDALLAILRGLYRKVGAYFVIEDAHWIDGASRDLIALLRENPIPLLVTSRTDNAPSWMAELGSRAYLLEPLSQADIQTVVEARFAQSVSNDLATVIADKSEGNPLIAEEIARALEQSDSLKDHGAGLEIVDENQSLLTGNLQQLVMSRVDLLPLDQKRLLQCAAAIGRDFAPSILAAATQTENITDCLHRMAGLVEPVGSDAWRFTHALIRDAVHSGLLTDQRTALHEAIGQVLEAGSGSAPELAYHFSQAQNPKKAVRYLIETAEGQLQAYTLLDADRTLIQVMPWIDADPDVISDDAFAQMTETWLRILNHAAQYARSGEVAAKLFPRLDRMPYSPVIAMARMFEAMAMTHRRDYAASLKSCEQTLADAGLAQDALGAAWAKVTLMRIYEETHCEPLSEVERLAREIGPVVEASQDRHLGMTTHYLLSTVYRSAGRRGDALRVADDLETAAETTKDRRARAFAQWSRAVIYAIEGNPEATLAMIRDNMREAIPSTADHLASECIEMSARVFVEPHDVVSPQLAVLLDELVSRCDYNLIHSMQWVKFVMLIRYGKLADGWRLLNELVDDAYDKGNVNYTRQVLISRAEILLAIMGLTDPDSEEPPERPRFPKARPGIADVWTFARLRISAKRQAAVNLQAYFDTNPGRVGTHDARAHIGLGLIAKHNKDHVEAQKRLDMGLQIARSEGLQILIDRAEKGLKGL